MNDAAMNTPKCSICGGGKEVRFSLPLAKNGKGWETKPICSACRWQLITQARRSNRVIRIFSLSGSESEAERRNGLDGKFRVVLEAYAKAQKAEAHKS